MDLQARCLGGRVWDDLSLSEQTSWLSWWQLDRRDRGLFPFNEVMGG